MEQIYVILIVLHFISIMAITFTLIDLDNSLEKIIKLLKKRKKERNKNDKTRI